MFFGGRCGGGGGRGNGVGKPPPFGSAQGMLLAKT